MNGLKKLFWSAIAFIALCVVSALVAAQLVKAQTLMPPPPVIGMADPSQARIEIKLDAIERRQKRELAILKAIHVKLFPLKLENSVIDSSTADE